MPFKEGNEGNVERTSAAHAQEAGGSASLGRWRERGATVEERRQARRDSSLAATVAASSLAASSPARWLTPPRPQAHLPCPARVGCQLAGGAGGAGWQRAMVRHLHPITWQRLASAAQRVKREDWRADRQTDRQIATASKRSPRRALAEPLGLCRRRGQGRQEPGVAHNDGMAPVVSSQQVAGCSRTTSEFSALPSVGRTDDRRQHARPPAWLPRGDRSDNDPGLSKTVPTSSAAGANATAAAAAPGSWILDPEARF